MSETVAERWAATRTFHHSLYTPAAIAAARAERGLGVSVCLPARECGQTVGEIVTVLTPLVKEGVIDEIVVIDAGSADGTAEVARRAGATVHLQDELMPELGPVLGKGDAMYRALTVLRGEIVCYLDADTSGLSAHYATGLIGPLVCAGHRDGDDNGDDDDDGDRDAGTGDRGIAFVKASYRRPFEYGGVSLPEGGGRVSRLLARPILGLFYPELAGVAQPLAGEIAARRELLERLPFATGYGVEIGMLIDVWREVGLEGIAQVDLEERRNRHQPLADLEPMARTALATIAVRVRAEGRLTDVEIAEPTIERPPLAGVGVGR